MFRNWANDKPAPSSSAKSLLLTGAMVLLGAIFPHTIYHLGLDALGLLIWLV